MDTYSTRMPMMHLFIFLFCSLTSLSISAQTILGQEDFDGGGIGFTPTVDFNDGVNDHFAQTDGTDISNVSGMYSFQDGTNEFWAAEDTDDDGGNGLDEQRVTFNQVAITGYEDIEICLDVAAGNSNPLGSNAYDQPDFLFVQYNTDIQPLYIDGRCFKYFNNGDNFNEPLHHDVNCNGDGSDGVMLTPTAQNFCFTIPNANTTGVSATMVGVRILVSMDAGNEEVAFDNIVISGTEISTAAVTLNLNPDSYCSNDGIITGIGGGSPAGGFYIGPGVADDGNGMTFSFNTGAAGFGPKTITYIVPGTGSATDIITVNMAPSVTLTGGGSYCSDQPDAVPTVTPSPVGGVFSGPGVTDNGNGMDFTFSPMSANIGANTITYTYIDATNSCEGTAMIDIAVFEAPTIMATLTDVSCPGEMDGAIDLTVTGSGNYNYNWMTADGAGLTPGMEDQAGLSEGTYDLTVTDSGANSCTAEESYTIAVGAAPPAPIVTDIMVCDGAGSTEIIPMSAGGGGGVTVLYEETFDEQFAGIAGPCMMSPATCQSFNPPSNGQWSVTGDASGLTATSDYFNAFNGVLNAQDTDTEICFTSSVINIAGYSMVNISTDFTEFGTHEASDYVDYTYIVDGAPTLITDWDMLGDANHTLIDDFMMTTVMVGGITGNTLQIEICVMNNASSEDINTDNVLVEGVPDGAPMFKFYDADPALGPTAVLVAGPALSYDPGTELGDSPETYWVTECTATCESVASMVTVTVNPLPEISLDGMDIDCTGGATGSITAMVLGTGPFTYSWTTMDGSGLVPTAQNQSGLTAGTYDLQVTDANGCMGMESIEIEDGNNDAPPSIMCPADVTVECGASTDPADTGTATGMDVCTPMPMVTYTDSFVAGCSAGDGVITRTWTAADAAGQMVSCMQIITIEDSMAPTFTLPDPVTIQCTDDPLDLTLTGDIKDAADDCDEMTMEEIWINELHYDNVSTDQMEFIEIAGTAGVDLSSYEIYFYNGSNDMVYFNFTMAGTIPDEGNGFGAVFFLINGLQNGAPDGIAIVQGGQLVQFISYEGTITAADGPAMGQTSMDIGVSENGGTPVGSSVQLMGSGSTYTDFTWSGPAPASAGTLNAAQTLIALPPPTPPMVTFMDTPMLTGCNGTGTISRVFTVTDACGNGAMGTQIITVIDGIAPMAVCQDITVELDANGMATITPGMVDNGSSDTCGDVTLSLDQETFDCTDLGTGMVTLTVIDGCDNPSTCTATVTVEDNIPPVMDCPQTITITLLPGECNTIYNYNVFATDNCDPDPVIAQTSGLPSGSVLEKDMTYSFTYTATDASGNMSSCTWDITVEEYPTQVGQMNCKSSLNVSLDTNCEAVITANELLTGGPYGCLNDFIVELFFDVAMTQPIGTSPMVTGAQAGMTIVGQVTNPDNGVSCWSYILIEDKLSTALTCQDYELSCGADVSPIIGGIPGLPIPATATAVSTGAMTYSVIGLDPCGPMTLTYTDATVDIDCSDNPGSAYSSIVTRIWTATDVGGNTVTCTESINLLKASIADVDPPTNFDGVAAPALNCEDKEPASSAFCGAVLGWNMIDAGDFNFPVQIGHPSPADELYGCGLVKWSGTGFPGGDASCGNLNYVFEDLRINVCGTGSSDGCYKIIRKWTVLDWCTGESAIFNQTIKVDDNVGPTITDVSDVTVSTEVWVCEASFYVPEPWIMDNCSDINGSYSVTASAGNVVWLPNLNRYVVENLPIGNYTYTVSATDCCGNTTALTHSLVVADLVPPVAIADLYHATSLTSDGTSKVFASTFDEGSFDGCGGPVYLKVIRAPDLLNTNNGSFSNQSSTSADILNGDDDLFKFGNQIYFDDYVKFECEDIGDDNLQVQLRVFDVDPGPGPVDPNRMKAPNGDLAGHFNDSWSNIIVEDKLAPTIIAPPNITVSCEFWFDMNNLGATFGEVVTDPADREYIYINDRVCPGHPNYNPNNPTQQYNVNVGLDGLALDNCSVLIVDNDVDNLICGQGSIVRIFTATDSNGKTATATQTITIADCDPYFVNDNNCFNFDPFDGVNWPCDVNTTTCGAGTSPDNTGAPIIFNDDNCALISVTYEDEEFPVVPDACFKVKRIWTVTDWCGLDLFDSDNNDVYDATDDGVIAGQWEYVQFLKVYNSADPTFTNCADVTICGYNLDCSGTTSLSNTISDDCTSADLLVVDFKIDAFNDGTFDFIGSNQAVYPYPNPNGLPILPVSYSDNGNGSYDITIGAETYPVGTHRILWSAEDLCSNVGTCQYLFTIEDCKLPTPKAINGLVVESMPSSQMITLPAEWFNADSYDNCGLEQLWVASPSAGPGQSTPPANAGPTVTFTCENIGTNTVDLWAKDVNGNWDYVTTYVIVQDNQGACGEPMGNISGVVESEIGEGAENITLQLDGNGGASETYSGTSGIYGFPSLPLEQNYTVTPEKTDELREGISTLDLVLISRHIIGLQPLGSPYKIIAADVNNDEMLNAFDLIDLQRVIIFDADAFPNNNSFRFVDVGFNFVNDMNPFETPFPESYFVNGLAQAEIADFVAVKIGDVNNSAQMNSEQPAAFDRSYKGELFFDVADKALEAGEEYTIDFTANDFKELLGYQFTMDVAAGLEIVDLKADASDIIFGTALINEGKLTASWGTDNMQGITHDDGAALFSITVMASEAAQLSDLISISNSDRFTRTEAYTAQLDHLDISLRFNGVSNTATNFELLQNQPNPFKDATEISFVLPEAGQATLTIYDVSGRMLKVIKGDYSKGYNKETVKRSDLGAAGVLYYELNAGEYNATRKMILL